MMTKTSKSVEDSLITNNASSLTCVAGNNLQTSAVNSDNYSQDQAVFSPSGTESGNIVKFNFMTVKFDASINPPFVSD